MHPLAAVVPGVEVPRSDVVAARIARKVGPLFGVPWEQNPFDRTWVCDFGTITLAEIARGAPYPSRAAQAALDAAEAEPASGWRPAGRGVWTPGRRPTPAAIAHATLNRFGPDTKSAVVLTGANRLLVEVTSAIADVCRDLVSYQLTPEARLAVWAGLVLEAFRGQPALVAAGIQARSIQRALTTPWGEHLLLPGLTDPARCEFGSPPEPGTGRAGRGRPRAGGAVLEPARLDLVDATPRAGGAVLEPARLDLIDATPRAGGAVLEPARLDLIDATLPLLDLPLLVPDGPLLSRADLLDDIATRWCRRLLQVGHPGRGITWVAEASPGHRRVQSYLRVGSAVAPFVTEVLALLGVGPQQVLDLGPMSALIARDDIAARSVTGTRARLIAAHVLANYLRFNDDLMREQPKARPATRALAAAAADLAARHLGPRDPVTVLLTAYAAYCAAWDLGRDKAGQPGSVPDEEHARARDQLTARLDELCRGWDNGDIDPGTASYLLEVGAMALGRLTASGPGLDAYWREAMRARGVDPATDLDSPLGLPRAQQYHLQNYAAFLASQATDLAGLRRALGAQQACAEIRDLVARSERAEYRSKFTSVRTSHQAAAVIIGRMLALPAAAWDLAGPTQQALIADGMRHVRAVLDNPATTAMLDGDDPEAIGVALAVLPVITAARRPVPDSGPREAHSLSEEQRAEASRLLRTALEQARRLGPDLPEHDHVLLAGLSEALDALVTSPG